MPSAPPASQTPPGTVITIGTFDGVHVGHAALVRAARELADRHHPGRLSVVAMVFDPHPLTTIAPAAAPARLMSFDDKAACLRALGADEIVRLEPRRELLDLSPEAFLDSQVMPRRPAAVVEGWDFCFGKNRAGDTDLLCRLGSRRGFATHVVEPVLVVLNDHSVVRAASTLGRWLLAQGRVDDAAIVLGRPHTLTGRVVQGDRRGRTIGFPTANLETASLLPADGVYAALARLEDGRALPAAVNIGERPTFTGAARTVEAHLITGPERASPGEWSALPRLPEYGWTVRLELLTFIRDQTRFAGIDALCGQLARDVERVRHAAARSHAGNTGVAPTRTTLGPTPALTAQAHHADNRP